VRSDRHIDPFDPYSDLAAKWPEWTVKLVELGGLDEVIVTSRQLILIDPARGGEEWAVAHACSHLDLSHHLAGPGGTFSAAQEADADWLARVRLDVSIDWPEIAVDGDPTQRLP
jgi:hypothetical protein